MNELKHPSCISYYLHETAVYFSQTLFRFYASVSYCFLSVDLVVMSRDHCFNQFYHLRRYRRHSTARNVQSEALVRHPLVPKVIYLDLSGPIFISGTRLRSLEQGLSSCGHDTVPVSAKLNQFKPFENATGIWVSSHSPHQEFIIDCIRTTTEIHTHSQHNITKQNLIQLILTSINLIQPQLTFPHQLAIRVSH